MERIKKNDKVKVIAGKDRGGEGVVIAILPKKGKIMVKGVGVSIKHTKARRQGEISGIKKEEAYIEASKVMPVCSHCKQACRVGSVQLSDGKSARVCLKCKENF